MAYIDYWFPTSVYYEDNILNTDEVTLLKNRCLEIKNNIKSSGDRWYCKVYTTVDNYNLIDDKVFDCITSKVNHHVNEFVKAHNSTHIYKATEGWVNIYSKDAYQETHYHEGFTFSAVYFLKAPEGSGDLIICDPKNPDMMPIKAIMDKQKNALTYKYTVYKAIENRLVIFRSYTPHLVTQGSNTEDRISLAFNF